LYTYTNPERPAKLITTGSCRFGTKQIIDLGYPGFVFGRMRRERHAPKIAHFFGPEEKWCVEEKEKC
jgi:hypothetical protein